MSKIQIGSYYFDMNDVILVECIVSYDKQGNEERGHNVYLKGLSLAIKIFGDNDLKFMTEYLKKDSPVGDVLLEKLKKEGNLL